MTNKTKISINFEEKVNHKVELIENTPEPEKLIEKAGKTCYKSDNKITKKSSKKFIKKLINNGHESVLEHASATFRISDISRACSHQLVRHRLASYSQESQRYVDQKNFDYVIPESIENNKHWVKNIYKFVIDTIANAYDTFVSIGIPKEDARYMLPNACTTEIVVTMNFRELRHFLKLRLSKHAQQEIREVAQNIFYIVNRIAPNVFSSKEFLNEENKKE